MLSTSLTTPSLSRRARTALDPMEKAPQLHRLGVSLQFVELREREGGGGREQMIRMVSHVHVHVYTCTYFLVYSCIDNLVVVTTCYSGICALDICVSAYTDLMVLFLSSCCSVWQ